MVWWAEKNDVIITDEAAFETIVGVIDGKQPSAANHPLRQSLTQRRDDMETAAYGFVDMAGLPALPENPKKIGLDGLKRIEFRWGFQDEALVSRVQIVAPAPRRGVFTLVDQPTFDLKSLPPLPAGHPRSPCSRSIWPRTYDQFVALVKAANPAGEQSVDAVENAIRAQFGLDLRNDLLKHLGPEAGDLFPGHGCSTRGRPHGADHCGLLGADAVVSGA